MTRLPHTFSCSLGHWHPIKSTKDLLTKRQPRCLLERILLEWASLDIEPSGFDVHKVANVMVGLPPQFVWATEPGGGGRGGPTS